MLVSIWVLINCHTFASVFPHRWSVQYFPGLDLALSCSLTTYFSKQINLHSNEYLSFSSDFLFFLLKKNAIVTAEWTLKTSLRSLSRPWLQEFLFDTFNRVITPLLTKLAGDCIRRMSVHWTYLVALLVRIMKTSDRYFVSTAINYCIQLYADHFYPQAYVEDEPQQILLSNNISVKEGSRITCYYVAVIVIIDDESRGRHTEQITVLN